MKKFYNGNTCAGLDSVAFWLKSSPSEVLPTYMPVSFRWLWPTEGSRNVDVPLHFSLTLQCIPLTAGLLKCIVSPRGNFLRSSQSCEKRLLDPSCLSVLPSAWNNSAPTGRILINFDIGVLLKNLPRGFKFHYNMTRITRTLHADLCTVHLWQSL
jgi:hypothetical protein